MRNQWSVAKHRWYVDTLDCGAGYGGWKQMVEGRMVVWTVAVDHRRGILCTGQLDQLVSLTAGQNDASTLDPKEGTAKQMRQYKKMSSRVLR